MPLGSEPSSELSPKLTSVTGRPVLKCVIPESSQPCVQRFEAREEAFKRNLVAVAHDKVVLHIEGGQGLAERGIERIDLFAEVRRLILGFAEGVSGQHIQAFAGVAQGDLQSVVIGVADGGLIGIAAEIRSQRPSRAVDRPVPGTP